MRDAWTPLSWDWMRTAPIEWRDPAPRSYTDPESGELIVLGCTPPEVPTRAVDRYTFTREPDPAWSRFSEGDVVMIGVENTYPCGFRRGDVVRIDICDEYDRTYRVVSVTDPGRSRWVGESWIDPLPEGVEIPTRSRVLEFKSSYMTRAHTPKTVSKVFRKMWEHNDVVPEFDTIVGTGLSGSLVLPSLARALTRHFGRKVSYLLVRKDNDGSHSSREVEGEIGTRWLFVDDLVETGSTLRRCIRKVASSVPDAELVGVFLYGTGDSRAGVGNGRLYPCSQVKDDGRWTYKGHKYSNESIDEFGTFHASF